MQVKVSLRGHLTQMVTDDRLRDFSGDMVIVPMRSSIAALLAQIGLPLGDVGFVARNGVACRVETALVDGDEVAVFPILAGG